jgi:hypothetical protein
VLHLKGIVTKPGDWVRMQFDEVPTYCNELVKILDRPYIIDSKRNYLQSAINLDVISDLLETLQKKLNIQKLPIFIDEAHLLLDGPLQFELDFKKKKPLFHFFVRNVQQIPSTIQILCGTQWRMVSRASSGTLFE